MDNTIETLKLMEILSNEELVRFQAKPRLIKHMATDLLQLTVKDILEVSNLLGCTTEEFTKRIFNPIAAEIS